MNDRAIQLEPGFGWRQARLALLAYAHMWLLMLQASAGKDDAFHADKFKVGAFFFARLLPELDSRVASLRAGADTLMALSEDSF